MRLRRGARATIAVRVGRLASDAAGVALVPAQRLDLVLRSSGGRNLGLLTRVRDVLPGRYVFLLTGRDGFGRPLPRGRYRIELVAIPIVRGPPASRQFINFVVQ